MRKRKRLFCHHYYTQIVEWENLDGVKKRVIKCAKCGKFKIVEKLPKPLLNGQIWIR